MFADMTISSLSTEYVQIPIQAQAGGLPYNPSGDVVQFAFVPFGGQQYPAAWYTGSWSATTQGIYLAQCLVGPENGGVVLVPGTYVVWVMITDSPEIPVKPSGTLTIT